MNATVGHNSNEVLKGFVDRLERVEDEIDGAKIDRSEIYKEAHQKGFETSDLKWLLKMRRKTKEQLAKHQASIERRKQYAHAVSPEQMNLFF